MVFTPKANAANKTSIGANAVRNTGILNSAIAIKKETRVKSATTNMQKRVETLLLLNNDLPGSFVTWSLSMAAKKRSNHACLFNLLNYLLCVDVGSFA